ncbi:glycosyltransferase [bacterium]|nr:glycosyltransferase [bacterium]
MENLNTNPFITVLMAVYNGEKYLREAIDSILNQTLKDFIFLIIDDGSADRTVEIIKSYKDTRIKLVLNEKNMGQIVSLNKGIELVETPFMARMDADDISMPERLEILYGYMTKDRNLSVVSSYSIIIDENGNTLSYYKIPLGIRNMKFKALFDSPVNHGSSLMRIQHIHQMGLYNTELLIGADLNLWVKLLADNYTILNIPEYLLKIRQHSQSQLKSAKLESLCNEYSYTLDYYIKTFTALEIDFEQVKKLALFLHHGSEFNKADLKQIQMNFRNILKNLNFEYPAVKKLMSYYYSVAHYHYHLGINCTYRKDYQKARGKFIKSFFTFPLMVKSLFAFSLTFTGKDSFHRVRELAKGIIFGIK